MAEKNMFCLSVVVSFKNEQLVLPELLRRLTAVLTPLGIDYELIFVNDASTDTSLALLTEASQTNPNVKVLNMSRNFGHDQCVLAGMDYSRGDAVLIMDADLQDPPELIPKLLEEFFKGVDVVYTTRLSRAGEPRAKLWLTSFGYFLLSLTSRFVPPNTGDFKLISRRIVGQMGRLNEKVPFFRGLVNWVGFKSAQVFYHREPRFAGTTKVPVFGGGPIKAFLTGMVAFSNAPITLAFVFGVIGVLTSFLWLVGFFIFSRISFWGWPFAAFLILFIGGIQLLFMGSMGLYVGAILDQVRDRPTYIVENTIGLNDRHDGKT